jgi:hypothetical protein
MALALSLKPLKHWNTYSFIFTFTLVAEVPYKTLLYLFIRGIAAGEFAFVQTAVLFRNFAY